MMETHSRSETIPTGRMVYVEARQGGVNPETVVRVVWAGGLRHEERVIFDTLEEALDYAQSLCDKKQQRGFNASGA